MRRSSRQLPLPMDLGPPAPPACLYTLHQGRYNPMFGQRPYKICITKSQHDLMFGGAPYRKPKKIGCGLFGCAYPTANPERVVKITNDTSDVAGMQRADENSVAFAFVPTLFDLFKLRSKHTSPRPVHAMIVERLKPLNSRQQREFDYPLSCVRKGRHMNPEDIRAVCCGDIEKPRKRATCMNLARDIPEAMQVLEDIGVPPRDVHSGNIGLDKQGRWKILDLGISGLDITTAPRSLGRATAARSRGRRRSR